MKPLLLINIANLEDLSIEADGYILGYEKYTFFAPYLFSYEEIKSVSHKNIYVLLNALIHQKDIEEAKKEVDRLINLGVNFMIQDFGLYHYLLTKVNPNKIIYIPYTYICNKEELSGYYDNYGGSYYISNELTLEEIKDTLSNGHGVVTLFGYTPIYQSYRHILSLYEKEKNLSLNKDNLYLQEYSRNDLYRVKENRYGSVVFRNKPTSLLEHYSYVKSAQYVIVDSLFLDKDLFRLIVKLSRDIIEEKINEEDVLSTYQKRGYEPSNLFKYQKTVLRK